MDGTKPRSFKLACLFLLIGSHVVAQEFDTHWIAYPVADSTLQVWFRRTYYMCERPTQASLGVKTTGRFELFVNERNVSTDILAPYREGMQPHPIAMEYDITRFLHVGRNTIAVWYSPAYPHIEHRQLSVTYSGRMKNGEYFTHVSDENWLCREANRTLLSAGGELLDNTYYRLKWNADEVDAACWLGAVSIANKEAEQTTVYKNVYPAYRVNRIRRQNYFDVEGDSVIYEFGTAFQGWIRVTLRHAKAGECVNIGGMEYVCRGETDEQACRKFTLPECRRIIICGDSRFRKEQIREVEGLEIVPYIHSAFSFY